MDSPDLQARSDREGRMIPDTAEKLKNLHCASQRDIILDAVAEMRANEATIARQAARIEALDLALAPFAKAAEHLWSTNQDADVFAHFELGTADPVRLTYGDLRAAFKARAA